ncbi:hypothetical protein EVAR_17264_1 [Eumeta japonica]|uniref:Uncharacterized protein n=1 Tax=Eumeta variegata TaxID=151549 RepID=A0A4C1TTB0_EUMVA|nr:hypothetical protein EVAR_17264_1 [Eumeta japonica]
MSTSLVVSRQCQRQAVTNSSVGKLRVCGRGGWRSRVSVPTCARSILQRTSSNGADAEVVERERSVPVESARDARFINKVVTCIVTGIDITETERAARFDLFIDADAYAQSSRRATAMALHNLE